MKFEKVYIHNMAHNSKYQKCLKTPTSRERNDRRQIMAQMSFFADFELFFNDDRRSVVVRCAKEFG
jgi:hypothetical protein